MRSTMGIMQDFTRTGQDIVASVPFSVSIIGSYVFVCTVCVSVAAVVNVVSIRHIETAAQAAVSFCALFFFALLLTCLTLTGLARLSGLRSLVGLRTRLATSTA